MSALQDTFCGLKLLHSACCRETADQVQKCLEENPQLANLWTPESHYSVRTSMYNKNARSESVSSVAGKNLIGGSANGQERDNYQRQCTEIGQVSAALCT